MTNTIFIVLNQWEKDGHTDILYVSDIKKEAELFIENSKKYLQLICEIKNKYPAWDMFGHR